MATPELRAGPEISISLRDFDSFLSCRKVVREEVLMFSLEQGSRVVSQLPSRFVLCTLHFTTVNALLCNDVVSHKRQY